MTADDKKHIPDIKLSAGEDQESRKLTEKESAAFTDGTLKQEAEKNQHRRRENFRDGISKAGHMIFWCIVVGIIALIITEFWHLITPRCWHYLNDAQKEKIETFLLSGVLASMASEFGRKYV